MKNFQNRAHDDGTNDQTPKIPSVTEYMTPISRLITIKEDTPVLEVLKILLDKRITGAPVVNEQGDVVGLIDDKDCLSILLGSAYYNEPVEKDTVSEYMSNVMKDISIENDIVDVANTFLTTPYKRLLVMDNEGKLAGQISRRDILIAIRDMNQKKW
ncbi:CBS domain-containing protein [Arcticibacterium luteifluviistationis]|uniref:Inosine-5-monophosphate dehydrogenase n=1 Tax=Arcticibacterium luteifluviistationis TaxID=1784714 RepID=A0A2Z4GHX2_9BACT|nr:CBS domain-containing protein [Arcticibacterium luteifluviistationis]AWW00559.1 inosine-5-monophosphate dehydrogenase [Arcticibacterium luteifluviistationis]